MWGGHSAPAHPSYAPGPLPRGYATVGNAALSRIRACSLRHLTFPSQKGPISSLQVTAFTLLTPDCFPPGTKPPPNCLLTPYKLAASIPERLLCLGQSTPRPDFSAGVPIVRMKGVGCLATIPTGRGEPRRTEPGEGYIQGSKPGSLSRGEPRRTEPGEGYIQGSKPG